MKTHFFLRFLSLSLLLIFLCFSCKKYTNDSESYLIEFESSTPLKEATYWISKPDKYNFFDVDAVSTLTEGELVSLSNYKYELDTVMETSNAYGLTISYSFDVQWGDTVDALVKATMIRMKTNEVLFQKSFHEDSNSGSFTIKL